MSMKKTWLLRLGEIREELTAVEAPAIDRAMCERLFGVRRRRALQLMHSFGGWQSGQAYLGDRLALLRQLEPLQESPEVIREQRRRLRLSETLEDTRRHRAAARVILPVERDTVPRTMLDLPQGVASSRAVYRWSLVRRKTCWRNCSSWRRRPPMTSMVSAEWYRVRRPVFQRRTQRQFVVPDKLNT
jgi:hypothetical protein